jgi:hypothetical protein
MLNNQSSIEDWRQAKAMADNPRPNYQFGSFTLTPAYGRVYTSKAAVLKDYNAGKDFISQPDGRYFNRQSAIDCLATFIKIRYGKRLEKVMVV